jgi:hypothetical protein
VIGASGTDFVSGDFVVRGFPTTNIVSNTPTTHQQKFSGVTSAAPSAAISLTANGSSGSHMMPALANTTLGRLIGSVIAYDLTLLQGSASDTATFSLTPCLVVCNNSGVYSIVGTPTFTLETSTVGAVGWDVPTLSIIGNVLIITAIAQSVALNWLGFLTFETNA